MPTLEDVAAAAGVSRATASRVVNGDARVEPARRAAVERAVADLGYVPNRAARALVTRRTDTVALVVPRSPRDMFDQPFFGALAGGLQARLGQLDRELVLLMGGDAASQARTERYLQSGHVDGAVVVGLAGSERVAARLAAARLPVVVWGRPVLAPDVPYVDADNVGGAREAVRAMLEAGRTRIATIAGPADTAAGADRLAGYREELAAQGRYPRGRTEHADFSRAGGMLAMRRLLEDDPSLDGVVAANDVMAAAALTVLAEAGRRVPGDVAVVGFDDSPVALATRPTLSSVRQPTEEIGTALVDMLIALMAGEPVTPVVLPTELVRRESF